MSAISREYHTFTAFNYGASLERHPPNWYDGNPKRCHGSGMPPGVQFHGELCEDGEPKYLCRCPWCDKPYRPGIMPEHTFVPIRSEGTGKFMYGIETQDFIPGNSRHGLEEEPK